MGSSKMLFDNEYLKSATYGIRYFMNNFVLISLETLLSIPTPAFIAGVVYVAWRVAGPMPSAVCIRLFYVGCPKWLVGSIRDYHLLRFALDSRGHGVWNSSAVWGAMPPAQKLSLSGRIDGSVLVALLSLLFRRSFIAAMSFIVAGIFRYISWTWGIFGETPDPQLYRLTYWVLFAVSFT